MACLKWLSASILICLMMAHVARADLAPATQPANAEFLDGQSGRDAIVDDSLDPYFSRMEDHEMTAKTGSPITGDSRDAKIAECKRRYQSDVMDFSEDDKKVLTFFVSRIQGPLTNKYPVFGHTQWSFIKTKNELEGGMAYTRGGHVILPEGILAQFEKLNHRLGEKSLPIGASLLIHEQTHVLERLHPAVFVPLFTNTFHFIHAKKIETDQWLSDRQLINPDGSVCDWIYPLTEDGKKTFVLPLLAFHDPNPTNLRQDIGTIAVTLQKTADGFKPEIGADGNPIERSLDEVPQYMNDEGSVRNNYHPNEIAADRFSELVVFDDLLPPADKTKRMGGNAAKMEERLKPIRDWATTAFAERAR